MDRSETYHARLLGRLAYANRPRPVDDGEIIQESVRDLLSSRAIPYTKKRIEVFETDEAELLMELRNYSQHQFLPRLDPTTYYSQGMPMAELQLRLDVDPLLKWDSLPSKVRKYLEAAGDSIDLLPIIGRYSKSVREFAGIRRRCGQSG